MSIQTMAWAFEQRVAGPIQKIVLIALADRCDMDAFISMDGVQEFCCITRETLEMALASLSDFGLLESQPDGLRLTIAAPVEMPSTMVPTWLRRELLVEAGFSCQSCGGDTRLAIDHIIPRSKGGTSERANLQVLCGPCNSSKGQKMPGQWPGRILRCEQQ